MFTVEINREKLLTDEFIDLIKRTPLKDRGRHIKIGLYLIEKGELRMDSGDWLFQFFSYSHLPKDLQDISKPFGELAEKILLLPKNPERTTALRKLLEAKDCAVRAVIGGDM